MIEAARHGRPRASSRETLAEAASELFFEQGYEATNVSDIARRAGVSRSSFFNYFTAKDDVFWAAFDARVATLDDLLDEQAIDEAGVRAALGALAGQIAPDELVLGFTNAEAMGITTDLRRGAAQRQAGMAERIAARLGRGVGAQVRGAVLAATFMTALRVWAESGAGRTPLPIVLDECLTALDG